MEHILGLDIGSNSVGSAWIDQSRQRIAAGVSVFPAGVEESDQKRGDPKNAKRRMARRTRITLARRAERKRQLRLKLIEAGLLPELEHEFKRLLQQTDPWELRRKGLDAALDPFEFGRVLLHLAQRRGALGLRTIGDEQNEAGDREKNDGKVKQAIGEVRGRMLERNARTFGEFMAMIRQERVTPIEVEDKRPLQERKGPRQWRDPVRNRAGSYEHCADRAMIRDEFIQLWRRQKGCTGATARLLTDELRSALDNEGGDAVWRHQGLLFGQRRATWDLGTLGRCVLHPEERCVPHADMYASDYLVVETVNNLRIIERGNVVRPLTRDEREKIKTFLSGPLGPETRGKRKGQPRRTANVTDLRKLMGWGRATKTTEFRFNIETDEDRTINTDWFSREIIHGAVTPEKWALLHQRQREGLNRAILKFDPDHEEDAGRLKNGVQDWAGLSTAQAEALVLAWKGRPRLDAKRLNMSRRAVRNLLTVMDRSEPWPDTESSAGFRWLTQIEARKLLAHDGDFIDETCGKPLDEHTRRRYATGAKGATARDRYYMRKHLLRENGEPIYDEEGLPLHKPPPAPKIGNPVVRKAIHEVRRHLIDYLKVFRRKPDKVVIELAREAKMGKKDADRLLLKNRLRNRIRNDIIQTFKLESGSATQQRAAVDRVIFCVQQGGVCPLCGEAGLTPKTAALGQNCEVAHIIPRASGGHNGLSNIVLGHTRCNRDMGRRTPREFWGDATGFDTGMRWIAGIFAEVRRPKPSEVKGATGEALWACYFTSRDDFNKIEQFKKDVRDEQNMTPRQMAATRYAARQVMAYLADALYGGEGLPERSTGGGAESDKRRIFATDGLWTSRLRREWGLFFDPHESRVHGLRADEQQHRREKDRGDHRHHAIDAVIAAFSEPSVQIAWEKRERDAAKEGINTADHEAMEKHRRSHPLELPDPFKTRDEFRNAVELAVFGEEGAIKPVCHRPVKRKLVGELHEQTLFGPIQDSLGNLTDKFTSRKSVYELQPKHLRLPRRETKREAVTRLADRRMRQTGIDEKNARKWARTVVDSPAFTPAMVDPPPEKSGIVRDRGLRIRLRECLIENGIDPDEFKKTDIKKLCDAGEVKQASGVPIRSVVLLRTMTDPVIISRRRPEYSTGRMLRDNNPASKRAYVGGNNHHIEIRVDGKGKLSGEIVTAFEASQRKLARFRAMREAGVLMPDEFRRLKRADRRTYTSMRRKYTSTIRTIEEAHAIVDRRDDDAKGGRFLMSLCEGETLLMKHKQTQEVGYFVVAKLDRSPSIVVVPHWDARAATGRKDAEGRKIESSKRDQFAIKPSHLKSLAPLGHEHVVKVRVGPLGDVQDLHHD